MRHLEGAQFPDSKCSVLSENQGTVRGLLLKITSRAHQEPEFPFYRKFPHFRGKNPFKVRKKADSPKFPMKYKFQNVLIWDH